MIGSIAKTTEPLSVSGKHNAMMGADRLADLAQLNAEGTKKGSTSGQVCRKHTTHLA